MSDGWGGTVDHVTHTAAGEVVSAWRDQTRPDDGKRGCRNFFSRAAVITPDGRVLVAWQAATAVAEGYAIDLNRARRYLEREKLEASWSTIH